MKTIRSIDELKQDLVADLRGALGDNLVAAVVHGPAARKQATPPPTPVLVAIVVQDDSIEALTALRDAESKWQRKGVEFSFFFSPGYLDASRDVFALEYLLLRTHHIVLTGDDVFAGIELSKKDLRLQCERELRGRVLHLRREIVRAQGKRRPLESLVRQSFPDFLDIFFGILEISGRLAEELTAIGSVQALEEVTGGPLPALKQLAAHELPADGPALDALVRAYLKEVDRILTYIDAEVHPPKAPNTESTTE